MSTIKVKINIIFLLVSTAFARKVFFEILSSLLCDLLYLHSCFCRKYFLPNISALPKYEPGPRWLANGQDQLSASWVERLPSRAGRVTLGIRGTSKNFFFKTWIELGDALLHQLCHVFYSHLHHFLTKFCVFKTVYIFWSKKKDNVHFTFVLLLGVDIDYSLQGLLNDEKIQSQSRVYSKSLV